MQSGQSKARLSFDISEWAALRPFPIRFGMVLGFHRFAEEKSKPVKSGFVGRFPDLNGTEAEESGRADLQVVP